METWRLGLDLGTNSIGWCALKIDTSGPSELLDLGVRVFSDGREPAAEGRVGDSLAVQRRLARGMRRQRDRHNRLKRKVYSFLIDSGLAPQDPPAREKLKRLDPYDLRTRALDGKLKPYELGRALFHLAVRRGFKSNRKEALAADKELSINLQKMKDFSEELKDSGSRSLGEYLYKKKCTHEPIRFRPGASPFYPERRMYEEEFKTIRAKQEAYYKTVDWDKLEDLIFFQRPLAPQERGRCQFYTDKYRAHKALPISHHFRMLQDINNLMMIDEHGSKIGLSQDEKDQLFIKLDTSRSVSFGGIRKLLHTDLVFNLENRSDDKLNGNETAFIMRKKEYFGKQWDTIPVREQDKIVELLIEGDSNDAILTALTTFDLSHEQQQSILNLTFSSATTNLSAEFMHDCAAIMHDEWLPYHEAVEKLGLHHSDFRTKELLPKLPYYGEVLRGVTIGARPDSNDSNPEILFGKIGNPTVHVALNQLQKVVNALLRRYGRPAEISIELSRELKQSKSNRLKIFQESKENKKTNDRVVAELKALGISRPNGWDIKKYKLWEELGRDGIARRCVYCGKTISATQLLSSNVEIEHILPFSRTLMNSLGNLTVAHKQCNAIKGNRTPEEAFASNPNGFNYSAIIERTSVLPRSKRNKFLQGALEDFNRGEDFIDRQLTDNAYLSRKAKEYLGYICPDNKVWAITGRHTSTLRSRWDLNVLLNANGNRHYKNREDHRHHAIDALVIALTDRGLIQKISSLNTHERANELKAPKFPFPYATLESRLKEILVSFKPDHGIQGRLFKETALGWRRRIGRVPWSSFTENDQIENICSPYWRRKFFELIDEHGLKAARKLAAELWEKAKKEEAGPAVFVYYWIGRKMLVDLKATEFKRIWDDNLREKIAKEISSEELNEKQLEDALFDFGTRNNIRRVRIIPDNTLKCYRIGSVPNKGYLPDDYLYLTVWAIPPHRNKKKWEYRGQFVSRIDAAMDKIEKPHPAAQKLAKLYKNDVLAITTDAGETNYARIAGFATTSNRVDIRSIYSGSYLADWLRETNKAFTSAFWQPAPGQNFVSINALWNKYSVKQVAISADGQK